MLCCEEISFQFSIVQFVVLARCSCAYRSVVSCDTGFSNFEQRHFAACALFSFCLNFFEVSEFKSLSCVDSPPLGGHKASISFQVALRMRRRVFQVTELEM